jgi:hypothetical protein
MSGDKSWIRNIIYQYNKKGFYTCMSQPGVDYFGIKIYKTLDERFKKVGETETCGIVQRAIVNGFMTENKAHKLYDKLKNDPKLVMFLSDQIQSVYDKQFEYCTLSYRISENGIKCIMYDEAMFCENYSSNNNEINNKHLPDHFCTSALAHSYNVYVRCGYPCLDNIVGISIMCKDWNDDTYLWNTLLELLKEAL